MSVIDNIYKAIDSVNDTLPPEQQVEKSGVSHRVKGTDKFSAEPVAKERGEHLAS